MYILITLQYKSLLINILNKLNKKLIFEFL